MEFLEGQPVTCEMRHATSSKLRDKWVNATCDMWNATCDMWHATCEFLFQNNSVHCILNPYKFGPYAKTITWKLSSWILVWGGGGWGRGHCLPKIATKNDQQSKKNSILQTPQKELDKCMYKPVGHVVHFLKSDYSAPSGNKSDSSRKQVRYPDLWI